MTQDYELIPEPDFFGERIDKFLSEKFTDISRTQIQKSFDDNLVTCNGKIVKPKYILRGFENINFRLIIPSSIRLSPQKLPLDIIFEDNDIIVINKPANLVVHQGNGVKSTTLVEGLLSHCKLSALGGEFRPGVVHRLDKDTSGAIIFAKTNAAYIGLIKMFARRNLEKIYQTIVCGKFSSKCGEINHPIGRNKLIRTKMTVSSSGKEAITLWKVVNEFGEQFSHLKVRILTGRTHQIRVHMSHQRHPIVGDTSYGYNKNFSKIIFPQRVMLHAAELHFIHPCSGEDVNIMAPLPEDFTSILSTLSKHFQPPSKNYAFQAHYS